MLAAESVVDVVVQVEPWAHPGDSKIRITPGYADEMRGLLTEAGITNSRGMEFSDQPIYEIIVVAVTSTAFWACLAGVIKAFVNRHQGKKMRVEVGGGGAVVVEIEGYPAGEVEKLIEVAASRFAAEEHRWQELVASAPEAVPAAAESIATSRESVR